jgi:hypothetical protein
MGSESEGKTKCYKRDNVIHLAVHTHTALRPIHKQKKVIPGRRKSALRSGSDSRVSSSRQGFVSRN